MTTKTRRWLRPLSILLVLTLSVGAFFAVAPLSGSADSVSELQSKLKSLQNEETALKKQLASYKNDVAKQQQYSDSLKAKIQNSVQQIDLLQQQIDLINADMTEKDQHMAEREQAIADTEVELESQFNLLGDRLRVIARAGNLSALQMVFNNEDYVDYLIKSNMVKRIADNDQKMMDALNQRVEELNGEKAELQSEKDALGTQRAEVEALKAEADAKKAELDTLYAESNAVLKKLQSAANSVSSNLQKKQKEEAALDKQIKAILSSNSGSYTGKYGDGTMFWPVPAVHNISSGFGRRWGTTHRGIDIANGSVPVYGKDVVAAADGKVIYTNTSGWGGGYGLFIMVDHGTDSRGRQIVTLYAHLSAVLVSVGQTVTGGSSVIGRAGSSGDVTGPHLHFEVRVDGTAIDPLSNGYLHA